MTPLQLQCPGCRQRLEVDAGFAGGVCRCSSCGTLMKVPRRSGETAAPVTQGHRPASPIDRPDSPRAAPAPVPDETTARPAPANAPDASADLSGSNDPRDVAQDGDAAFDTEPRDDVELDLDLAALRGPEDDAEHDARDAEPVKAPTSAGRLQHYLRALHRHYRGRTPQDLVGERLRPHAKYLVERHHRIASRLLHMISPKGHRRARAEPIARRNPAWRDYFNSASQNHEAIAAELDEIERYWRWVTQHRRLPSRLTGRFARYNKQPIAHPWATLSASVLECLGQLDAEISADSMRTRRAEQE